MHGLTRATRVRRPVKTIRCRHGTNPDRIEKNIVTGISTHAGYISDIDFQRLNQTHCVSSFTSLYIVTR